MLDVNKGAVIGALFKKYILVYSRRVVLYISGRN